MAEIAMMALQFTLSLYLPTQSSISPPLMILEYIKFNQEKILPVRDPGTLFTSYQESMTLALNSQSKPIKAIIFLGMLLSMGHFPHMMNGIMGKIFTYMDMGPFLGTEFLIQKAQTFLRMNTGSLGQLALRVGTIKSSLYFL